jgi:hypothetical protein
MLEVCIGQVGSGSGGRILKLYVRYIVGIHEVRWNGCGTEPAGEYSFSFETEMRIVN